MAKDRHDCFWLDVVAECHDAPQLQEPIQNPARSDWHEVTKVAHYYPSVNGMAKPRQVGKDTPLYRDES